MRYHEFTALLEQGEGLTVEFKRRFSEPEKIAREMIAFANTSGGVMLFGVDDDASVVGVGSEKEEMELIARAAERSSPPLNYETSVFSVRGLDVVCVHIPESGNKPHYLREEDAAEPRAYIRVGEHSVQASREMVRVLQHQSGSTGPVRLIVGEAERRLFAWFESHERITVAEYASLINVSVRRASRLLVRLVRAGVLAIHTHEKSDFFTLTRLPQ